MFPFKLQACDGVTDGIEIIKGKPTSVEHTKENRNIRKKNREEI